MINLFFPIQAPRSRRPLWTAVALASLLAVVATACERTPSRSGLLRCDARLQEIEQRAAGVNLADPLAQRQLTRLIYYAKLQRRFGNDDRCLTQLARAEALLPPR